MTDRPPPIDYASPRRNPPSPSGRKPVSAEVATASLAAPLLVAMALWGSWWRDLNRLHLLTGEWERIVGVAWMATAVASIGWIAYFLRRPFSPYAAIFLILHALVVGATLVFPGPIFIAWLMHWYHGPGA